MIIEFEGGEIDIALREIRRGGVTQHVEPQVFDVIRHLIDHRSRVVSREELLDSIWGDRFVSPSALAVRVKAARAALGDDGRTQRIIRTSHGIGYRFVASVNVHPDGADRAVTPIRYVEHAGADIAYQISGDGPIDIVLVSGFVSHLTMDWDDPRHARFLDRLGLIGRLIRFDKRGTGLSDRSAELPDIETRCRDVQAVMNAAGSESSVIVGYSEGGPMAIRFASMYPRRCSALVLYGTYAKRIFSNDYPWAPTAEERLAYAHEVQEDWAFEADMQRMCPSADEAMAIWWGERCRASASPSSVRKLVEQNSEVDVRDALAEVRAPTLVLHRTNDLDAHVDEGRYIADRIRDATFVELPGSDHFVAIDPDQIVDPIERFVTRPEG